MSADMPDAGASRKQQFEITPLRSGDTCALRAFARMADDPQAVFEPILGRPGLLARAPYRNPQESIRCRSIRCRMPADSISRITVPTRWG